MAGRIASKDKIIWIMGTVGRHFFIKNSPVISRHLVSFAARL
jgi:hypothetical protein